MEFYINFLRAVFPALAAICGQSYSEYIKAREGREGAYFYLKSITEKKSQ